MSFASSAFQRAKKAVRLMATGETSRFADDEIVGFLFTPLQPVKDLTASCGRLSVLVPSLSARSAFGGLATHVELPILAFNSYLKAKGWALRFICTSNEPNADDNIIEHCLEKNGLEEIPVEYVFANRTLTTVAVSANDVFLGSLWHSYYDALPLLDFQANISQRPHLPYVSMIQDYEAGFHPWSSAYMMALAFYGTPGYAHLFNSKELEEFYLKNGHPVQESVSFDPVMNAGLVQRLSTSPSKTKEKQVIVYARPHERRNCFYILRKALEEWSYSYKRAGEWKIVSAGSPDVRLDLAPGVRWENRAKLSIDDYADELAKSAIGVSLMASPHPSYPPLEMAHYGALTITNSFQCKDLSSWHDNIRSLATLTPSAVARAIGEACDTFDADPRVGLYGRSHKPSYTQGHSEETLAAIGKLIAGRL